MINQHKGFGLVEVLVALALGVVVALGISQIFITAKQTHFAQDASARLQEDARYALSRMVQDIRMVGMFGCVSLGGVTGMPTAFSTPITWDGSVLQLITASPGPGDSIDSSATWTLLTNCVDEVTLATSGAAIGTDQVALPIRQVEYKRDGTTLQIREGGAGTFQPLISSVQNLQVTFGMANDAAGDYVDAYGSGLTSGDMAKVRSVRLELTMRDPGGRVADQTYAVVAALRNRLL